MIFCGRGDGSPPILDLGLRALGGAGGGILPRGRGHEGQGPHVPVGRIDQVGRVGQVAWPSGAVSSPPAAPGLGENLSRAACSLQLHASEDESLLVEWDLLSPQIVVGEFFLQSPLHPLP
jgi:hypothetical protein